MLAAVFAEVFGTALFFLCILTWGKPIPIVIGLLAAIYAFGKISGGHFNPGVSFMMLLKGEMNIPKFVVYVCAQLIGAILALVWWKATMPAPVVRS